MHSSKRTLKLLHWTRLVSWNSSIMTCSKWHPIFSKINGESLSSMRECRSDCVSLSKKRLASLFNSWTFRSILLSRRSWLRCRSVISADLYILTSCGLAFSVSFKRGMSVSWTSANFSLLGSVSALTSHSSGHSMPLMAVFISSSLSEYLPFFSLTKYPQTPEAPLEKSEISNPFSSKISKNRFA